MTAFGLPEKTRYLRKCLVVERSKFAKRVMVSAGVCYGGMGRLNFIPDKATLSATLYVETLLTRLIEDCKSVLPSGFHSSRTVQLLTRQSWFRTLGPSIKYVTLEGEGVREGVTVCDRGRGSKSM